jgi:type IV secretory pathway VirB2 component (pilin)
VLRHNFLYQIQTVTILSKNNYTNLNKTIMGNLLYMVAVILIIGWAIGFFAFQVGWFIHLLLVIAIISIIFRLIQGK